ncbi:NAD(P)-dependent oxidoreductase [Dietzia maris]|uniref:NAD-dependent epimerase/dehydratase family protein n=1 Tax=Dietzia maris TaxID=37915 RepID=UPI00344C8270
MKESAIGEVRALRVGVVGATGFVGAAVVETVRRMDRVDVVSLRAPRAEWCPGGAEPLMSRNADLIKEFACRLVGLDAVVNCAGNPGASSSNREALWAANCATAGVVAAAATRAGVPRLVHVSSAAVLGRAEVLSDTLATRPENAYGESKADGETAVLGAHLRPVIYRPPGVHGRDRKVTLALCRLARSRFASVAAPGDDNAPQALIGNVASAIGFLATSEVEPPLVVTHPSEGLETGELLELLGGSSPRLIPRVVAGSLLNTGFALSKLSPWLYAQVRRVEVLWFGQRQGSSWLSCQGWRPPYGKAEWERLGVDLRANSASVP